MKTGKTLALTALKENDFSGLCTVAGRGSFYCAWYGQKPETLMAEAKHLLYTCKRGKPLKVMSLPLTTPNIFLHSLQPHHAVTLDKAADQQCPPQQHYTKFG